MEHLAYIQKHIKECIEKQVKLNHKKFILYPFGERGILIKKILNECYGINEEIIIDNHLSKYNKNIKEISYLKEIDWRKYIVLITSENPDSYDDIRKEIRKYVLEENIVDLFEKKKINSTETKVGKYSYGPLCDHALVESVGAFCSFAAGTDVVSNHAVNYISTHPFLYNGIDKENHCLRGAPWWKINEEMEKDMLSAPEYFSNVEPKGKRDKFKRICIGNDVWLGRNVLITNGANIGNGVIAGAGAVITKDVPDYAVVAGVPARIIRYRYTEEQIDKLLKISWWDWPDEKIRMNYDDFYLDIEEFIGKHYIDI